MKATRQLMTGFLAICTITVFVCCDWYREPEISGRRQHSLNRMISIACVLDEYPSSHIPDSLETEIIKAGALSLDGIYGRDFLIDPLTRNRYRYYTVIENGTIVWFLVSPGTDDEFDFDPMTPYKFIQYDPTNGIGSRGDWVFSNNFGPNEDFRLGFNHTRRKGQWIKSQHGWSRALNSGHVEHGNTGENGGEQAPIN